MFSNQYMGTRFASRSLPRPASSTTSWQQGPYSRLDSYNEIPKPVNARPMPDENEEVDYSFMNLPVRERRKLFLGGGRPSRFNSVGQQSMTMPRMRMPSHPPPSRYETQSEYGADVDGFRWESNITPSWVSGTRSAPSFGTTKKSSTTGTIILQTHRGTTPRATTPVQRPSEVCIRQHSQYATGPFSPSSPERQQSSPGRFYTVRPPQVTVSPTRQPQYSTTIRVHDPYTMSPQGKVVSNGTTRVYPGRRYPSTMGRQVYGFNSSDTQQGHPIIVPGRMVQPLRVNVFSSDSSTVHYSPTSKVDNSWSNATPVYPAYPANLERSYHVDTHVQPDRYRRGLSVQPVAIYSRPSSPVYRRTESQQIWRPLQAPNWVPTEQAKRHGRYISSPKSPSVRQKAPEPQDQYGVSEF
ncbi:hypothetical protein T265_03088 [Opisthorchis viverrini]|uniref:Uncharacterized protein n=2 Tax=Opisthorchis viverrini TaxID=6198 RepID=A0A074ZTM9_OPIVI|nr:hypothetical protein T265_03088 [Opisthorchis viverrini]KER30476.1 hypothetical protein T265_03088 [Opisthorchis viverrini]